MKKRQFKESFLTCVFIGVILTMLCSIGVRYITQNLLFERLNMDNAVVRAVLGYNTTSVSSEDSEIEQVDIDWETLYPHDDDSQTKLENVQNKDNIVNLYKSKIDYLKQAITACATERLIGYRKIIEISKKYENGIGWNIISYAEYNGVRFLDEGYLAGVVAKNDVTDSANEMIDLSNFCEEQGTDFLYVVYPSKISKYEDTDISGVIDFSNQNADDYLLRLSTADVNYFDIRESIHEAGLSHRDLFYNTDHHWKAETGLWASELILKELHERFDMDTHSEVLDADNFNMKVYEDWFLGSQGKKVTLARVSPDNFTLIYPKDVTKFHYEIPNLGIDLMGDFSVTYDMSQINELDYYNLNPYGAYNHGDQPLIKIENELIENNGKILIIHTSFSNCVIPFLAMDIKNVDALDLRYFTGSVQSYIKQTKPNVVIVTS